MSIQWNCIANVNNKQKQKNGNDKIRNMKAKMKLMQFLTIGTTIKFN